MISKIMDFIKSKIRGEFSTDQLIKMGLNVGENFGRHQECIIDPSHCWLISIGNNVTLAPRVHILAHDASTKYYLGYTKIGLVKIEDNVFIGANSIVLPNVRIGKNSIIGSGSVVTKDIPSGCVAVGNPAKVICKTEDYLNKNRELMKKSPVYDEKWTLRSKITNNQKKEMIKSLELGEGYVD